MGMLFRGRESISSQGHTSLQQLSLLSWRVLVGSFPSNYIQRTYIPTVVSHVKRNYRGSCSENQWLKGYFYGRKPTMPTAPPYLRRALASGRANPVKSCPAIGPLHNAILGSRLARWHDGNWRISPIELTPWPSDSQIITWKKWKPFYRHRNLVTDWPY